MNVFDRTFLVRPINEDSIAGFQHFGFLFLTTTSTFAQRGRRGIERRRDGSQDEAGDLTGLRQHRQAALDRNRDYEGDLVFNAILSKFFAPEGVK
jgi:hypothetical protein